MKVLITGETASGKTTISKELKRRGHACIDDVTDGRGLGVWYDLDGNRLPHNINKRPGFSWDSFKWGWDMEKLETFLNDNDPAIVCGRVDNILEIAANYFDKVVLLDADAVVINARLNRRLSGFGRKPGERQAVLERLPQFRKELSACSPYIIDADQPVGQIADQVINIATGNEN